MSVTTIFNLPDMYDNAEVCRQLPLPQRRESDQTYLVTDFKQIKSGVVGDVDRFRGKMFSSSYCIIYRGMSCFYPKSKSKETPRHLIFKWSEN